MGEPIYDRLLPAGPTATADELAAELRPWERPSAERPRVLVNMVATLDGHITIGGKSGPIGGEHDHAMFHALRTVVDAVLIGTGTLRAERYGRLVRDPARRARRTARGLAADPDALLITRSGNVPWEAPLFEAPEQRVVVAAPPGAVRPPEVAAEVVLLELEDPGPAVALRALRERTGARAVLCEGGPALNRALVAEGVLDELHVTLAPLLAGGDDALRLLSGAALPEPARLRPARIVRGGDEVFLRYERA